MLFSLFVFALMASAISANKIVLYAIGPSLLVGIRMFFGGSFLVVFNYLRGKNLSCEKLKKHALLLIVIAVFTTLVPSTLKAYGLKYLTSSKSAFLGALDPFFASIFAYFLLGERLTLPKFLGVLMAIIGTFILISGDASCSIENLFCFSWPELAALSGVATSRFGWMIAQKALKNELFSPTQMNTVTMLISAFLSPMVAYVTGEKYGDFLTNASLAGAPFSILYDFPFSGLGFRRSLFFFILYTVIIGNIFAYNLYAHVLKKHSAVFVSLASFSVPLFVHLFGCLFLSEKFSLNFLLACFITFMGLLIFFLDENKKSRKVAL